MPVKKSYEEVVVVDGPRDQWLEASRRALEAGGFKSVEVSQTLNQIQAKYRKATTRGEITVALLPEGDKQTKITMKVSAAVDNIYRGVL